jgi:hypothetical protein
VSNYPKSPLGKWKLLYKRLWWFQVRRRFTLFVARVPGGYSYEGPEHIPLGVVTTRDEAMRLAMRAAGIEEAKR